MEIASHHTESKRVASGIQMEKRLLLHWIALQGRDVAEWDAQRAALVESHPADAAAAFAN